jgi:hypothetical protein
MNILSLAFDCNYARFFFSTHSDNLSTSFESIMLQNDIDEGIVVSWSPDIALDC